MAHNFKEIFEDIEKQYSKLINSCDKDSFIENLKAIARWNEEPNDYEEPKEIKFPESIHIAYAVCHPECGVHELIVDGSTQKCQRCGGLMFRTEIIEYKKKK